MYKHKLINWMEKYLHLTPGQQSLQPITNNLYQCSSLHYRDAIAALLPHTVQRQWWWHNECLYAFVLALLLSLHELSHSQHSKHDLLFNWLDLLVLNKFPDNTFSTLKQLWLYVLISKLFWNFIRSWMVRLQPIYLEQ